MGNDHLPSKERLFSVSVFAVTSLCQITVFQEMLIHSERKQTVILKELLNHSLK